MASTLPDTLNTIPRLSSSSGAQQVPSTSSASVHLQDDSEGNILEEMEQEEARQAKRTRSKKRKSQDDDDDDWTVELRANIRTNQALLERLLVDRPQPINSRESFIRYVSDMLRSVPDDDYEFVRAGFVHVMHSRMPSTSSHLLPSTSVVHPPPHSQPIPSTSTAPPPAPPPAPAQQPAQQGYPPSPYTFPTNFPSPSFFGSPSPWNAPATQPRRDSPAPDQLGRVLASSIGGEDWSLLSPQNNNHSSPDK